MGAYTLGMSELKTKRTDDSVEAFLDSVGDTQRREDAIKLLDVFEKATGYTPALWGKIVGYGMYHYKSERSSQEGDWPLTGFSPRKQNLTIYVMPGTEHYQNDLKNLGKHTVSRGSCIYIKKLSDVDTEVLARIVADSVERMKRQYNVTD